MSKLAKTLLLILFLFTTIRMIPIQNVFDEIYHSRINNDIAHEYNLLKPYHGNFRFMPQIEETYPDIEAEFNLYGEYYKSQYLNQNERLQIYCALGSHPDTGMTDYLDRKMTFIYDDMSEEYVYYQYTYYVSDRLLVYKTNDPENTEKKQFLFDIFLKDYFEALSWRSGYSMDNLGYFKFIDTTIAGYEEGGELYQNSKWELPYQIPAVVILAAFYACYFIKMLSQRKKGIKTEQLGKGKSGNEKRIEIMVKIAAYLLPLVELASIYFKTTSFPMWVRIVGIAIGSLGVIVFILSVITMKDNWRAGVSSEDRTKLVTEGIYQVSRNPAFLGFDLVYIGILILFFNWILFLITVFAIVIFHLQIVCVEEPFLRSAFGEEYLAYVEKVERYIGIP